MTQLCLSRKRSEISIKNLQYYTKSSFVNVQYTYRYFKSKLTIVKKKLFLYLTAKHCEILLTMYKRSHSHKVKRQLNMTIIASKYNDMKTVYFCYLYRSHFFIFLNKNLFLIRYNSIV